MKILVLNSGSSSLKYQLIEMDKEEVLAKGNFERIGQKNSFLTHKIGDKKHKFERYVPDHAAAMEFILKRLMSTEYGVIENLDEIEAVGHRIVHGGEYFQKSTLITDDVLDKIKKCIELAPLHNPAAIAGIEACKKLMPNIPEIAVFDTAFHQTIPEKAYIYPIPYKYYEKYKIRKYGAHGMSHQYVAEEIAKILNKPLEDLKIVSCHLGQGASVCAIKNGKSVDTSMGFTPLGGIPMGTRSGDLDPSILLYIMRKLNYSPDQIEEMLNKHSGVYGISEVSVDFRDIESESLEGNYQAQLALEVFAYSVAQYIAKYAVSMQGLDILIFTAGVGEKGPISRKQICDYLPFLGIELDDKQNEIRNQFVKISKDTSKVEIYVVPTNEELLIARDTKRIALENI